jgi:hypothetical protein
MLKLVKILPFHVSLENGHLILLGPTLLHDAFVFNLQFM